MQLLKLTLIAIGSFAVYTAQADTDISLTEEQNPTTVNSSGETVYSVTAHCNIDSDVHSTAVATETVHSDGTLSYAVAAHAYHDAPVRETPVYRYSPSYAYTPSTEPHLTPTTPQHSTFTAQDLRQLKEDQATYKANIKSGKWKAFVNGE